MDTIEAGQVRPNSRTRTSLKPQATGAAAVLASFNTWSFKREQASDVDQIETRIDAAMQAGRPIPFILYWGKGPRDTAARPDAACIDYLSRLAQRIKGTYPEGCAIRLIFTDTHALINGHSPERIASYFGGVRAYAEAAGFSSSLLSEVVCRSCLASLEDEVIDAQHVATLSRSAERWYRGPGTMREGAIRYLRTNMLERRALEVVFPEVIFLTFNGSDQDFLFPERLPRFYMYSLRKGFSIKPWFLDADGRPTAGAS